VGEVWIPEAERLTPAGHAGTMSGIGGPRATLHCTVSDPGSFDAMVGVLTRKAAEPHLVWDPLTDRLGQFFPLTSSARALVSGSHAVSHNKMGTVNIQVEVCARPVDWTAGATFRPGPRFRAMMRAIRSHGVRNDFVARLARTSDDNVRQSWATFSSTSAGGARWWGHCNVPAPETHWDPGPISTARFFAAGAPLPPATTPSEVPMFLVRVDGAPAVYTANTIHARWVRTPEELARVRSLYAMRGWPTTVTVVDSLSGIGALVGPTPPTATAQATQEGTSNE
jgi:hypothetical protein